jgi:hypothetical protein
MIMNVLVRAKHRRTNRLLRQPSLTEPSGSVTFRLSLTFMKQERTRRYFAHIHEKGTDREILSTLVLFCN